VIKIEDLHKHFGAVRALDGVSLSVAAARWYASSGWLRRLREVDHLRSAGVTQIRNSRERVDWNGIRNGTWSPIDTHEKWTNS
jgi:ABC-type histidine transport system ATPase subunit